MFFFINSLFFVIVWPFHSNRVLRLDSLRESAWIYNEEINIFTYIDHRLILFNFRDRIIRGNKIINNMI